LERNRRVLLRSHTVCRRGSRKQRRRDANTVHDVYAVRDERVRAHDGHHQCERTLGGAAAASRPAVPASSSLLRKWSKMGSCLMKMSQSQLQVAESRRSRWRSTRLAAALLLGLAVVPLAAAQTATVTTGGLSAGAADPVRYLDNIKALTTPQMEGRGDGTAGLTRAAKLIEDQYKRLGLEPAGLKSYLQPFDVTTGAKLAGRNEISWQNGATPKILKLDEDFVPFSFSATGEG